MSSSDERIAVLEEQHRQFGKEFRRVEDTLDDMNKQLTEINRVVSRQRGFWAGVTFLASIVGFAISQVWQFLHRAN